MKKGDVRKQEILETAEYLFCLQGYEKTSIQDILDQLNCSKGSFYHHFLSKESLLEEICDKHAQQIHISAYSSVDRMKSTVENLNVLLSGLIPFNNEKIPFILVFLRKFTLPEGRMMRMSFCDALSKHFSHDLIDLLVTGHQRGELICHDPDTCSDLILTMTNRLWVKICITVITYEETDVATDISSLMCLTDCYRLAIERIIALPYGSLKLADIQAICRLSEQIHQLWTA